MVFLGQRLVLVVWAQGTAGGGDEYSLGVGESPFSCLLNWSELRCFSFSLFMFIAQIWGEEQV